MLRPLTVVNMPVTALMVKIVKVFPIEGRKPLIILTLRVPFRLAPFAILGL